MASAAVLAARARRLAQADEKSARLEWFSRNVASTVAMSMHQRVKLATDMLKSRIVKNISVPVGKVKAGGGRGAGGRFLKTRIKVTERSKPGEFPRAETTQLMKTIFSAVARPLPDRSEGYVGTPLDYGLVLEVSDRLDRSFLLRTFNEQYFQIKRLLTGPIR